MRNLYTTMRNKLYIATLAVFMAFSGFAQSTDGTVASAENNFYNQSLDTNNKIEIYPNPAVDYVVVQISNSTLENTAFEMHSIIGNEVIIHPEDLGNGKYRIPVKEFATGYYFLVVKDEITRFKKAYRFLKN